MPKIIKYVIPSLLRDALSCLKLKLQRHKYKLKRSSVLLGILVVNGCLLYILMFIYILPSDFNKVK